jgi:hypothetical protein
MKLLLRFAIFFLLTPALAAAQQLTGEQIVAALSGTDQNLDEFAHADRRPTRYRVVVLTS